MPVNFAEIALNVELDPDGIWRARTDSKISYPAEGNRMCFALEDSSFWFRHRNNCILQALNLFPPPGTFFDIGGGNGYVARAIERAGRDVVLIEPGPAGVCNAKERGIRHILQATLADAQFLPGTLPSVGLFDVIEHMEDDRAFLETVHRLQPSDGRLYATVPAFEALWAREDEEAGHCRRYTLRSFARVLAEAGYRVEFATYFFTFLPVPIFLARTVPYRLGLTAKKTSEETMRSEHRAGGPLVQRVLKMLTEYELRSIASRRQLKWGGSCLAIARRV